MKQITQKFTSESMGGYSDTRLRLFIFGFMSLGLIMTPFLGMLASFSVVIVFAAFTAVKINEFQQNNWESILLHLQAMDRMYDYGAKAEYYKILLKRCRNNVAEPEYVDRVALTLPILATA